MGTRINGEGHFFPYAKTRVEEAGQKVRVTHTFANTGRTSIDEYTRDEALALRDLLNKALGCEPPVWHFVGEIRHKS